MARTKKPLTGDQVAALDHAARWVTAWREAEGIARRAVLTAREAGVPVRDVAAATGVPGGTITSWTAAAKEQDEPDAPDPAPGPPGREQALRIMQAAADSGYSLDDVEQLIRALPSRRG